CTTCATRSRRGRTTSLPVPRRASSGIARACCSCATTSSPCRSWKISSMNDPRPWCRRPACSPREAGEPPAPRITRPPRSLKMRKRLVTHGLMLVVGAAAGLLLTRFLDQPAQGMAQAPRAGGPEERVRQLKLDLPKPTKPTNTLVSAVRVGDLLFVSGMGPAAKPDGSTWTGRLGQNLDVKEGREAA